ncbi:MAG: cytochrome C [Ferruginibacter sp.]
MKSKHLSLTLILIAFVTFFSVLNSCNNNDSGGTDVTASNEDSVKKLVERGKYLAHHVAMCMDCHSQRDFNQFSGPVIAGSEGMGGEIFDEKLDVPGVIYARNITSDTVNGIGKWTDEEIIRAITRGISRNGDTLFPIMPYMSYNIMHKDDIKSIVAYIRTLKPNSNKIPERKLFMPISMAYPPLRSSSLDGNVKPDVSDIVKYGEYMMNNAACMDCHTPMTKEGQFIMEKFMAGGWKINMSSFEVTAANITPDSTTGIGTWTEEMFLDKFKHYRDPAVVRTDPGKNNTLMPWTMYAQMDDFDIKAIYRYLRTIPAVNNKVEKYPQ